MIDNNGLYIKVFGFYIWEYWQSNVDNFKL